MNVGCLKIQCHVTQDTGFAVIICMCIFARQFLLNYTGVLISP